MYVCHDRVMGTSIMYMLCTYVYTYVQDSALYLVAWGEHNG